MIVAEGTPRLTSDPVKMHHEVKVQPQGAFTQRLPKACKILKFRCRTCRRANCTHHLCDKCLEHTCTRYRGKRRSRDESCNRRCNTSRKCRSDTYQFLTLVCRSQHQHHQKRVDAPASNRFFLPPRFVISLSEHHSHVMSRADVCTAAGLLRPM